jgi:hypothetical protein
MDDTLEKRINDLEYVLAHLPQDLDARFCWRRCAGGGAR